MFTPELCVFLNGGQPSTEVASSLAGAAKENFRLFSLAVMRAVTAGLLQPDKAPAAFTCAIAEKLSSAQSEILADSLWFAWLESEGSAAAEEQKTRLADFGREALKASLVSKHLLMEVSEGDFMEWSGLIVSYRDGWRKKEIRANTRHVYTQRKFNLLREESEGYAKIVTLLNQAGSGALENEYADAVLGELKALIGFFDLDPNHVCSLVIDAFAAQPDNAAFLRLLPAFSSEALSQLLGFHFSRDPAPVFGLYSIAAKMIHAGYVSIEELLAHFATSDEEVKGSWKEGLTKMEQAVKRIGVISLTQGTDAGEGAGAAGVEEQGRQQRPMKRPGQTAAALDLDPRPFALHATGADGGASNQRIALLAALLQCGAWEEAIKLSKWLSTLGITDIAMFPAVGRALCQLLATEIEPLYQQLHPGGVQAEMLSGGHSDHPEKVESLQLSERALELLHILGHHLYHDVATLTQLTRIVGAALSGPYSEAAIEILSAHILPSASLIPSNAALVLEVWTAISRLTYTQRFCLYSELKDATASSMLLTASAKLAETEVRRILRRVTAPANKREAKQTMRPLGRMLAKIMHATPLSVSEQLLRQVMGMPGMVVSITEALKFLTPAAFDVATYVIIRTFSSGRRKLKEDGINLEEWFQWLAAFTGLLSRKHEEVEITALLQYIANQLKGCESLDLLVLKEMVATMSGVSPVFDISDNQLDALSGSEALVAQVMAQGDGGHNERAAQRGMQRLLAALRVGTPEHQLAIPLLILLAQQRKLITLQPQSFHLKLVAELYDKCHEVTMQYVEFLRKALSREEYAAMLPSIADLALEYRVDPEVIFELYRPLIKGITPPVAPVEDTGAAADAAADTAGEGGIAADKDQTERAGKKKNATPDAAIEDDEEGEISSDDEDGQLVKSSRAVGMEVEDGEVPDDGADRAHTTTGTRGTTSTSTSDPNQWGGPVWDALAAQTASLAPEGGFRGMTQTLFVTFWALSLYDLDVPVARYETTLTQVKANARIARDDLEATRREGQKGGGYGGHGGHGVGGGYGMQPPPPPPPSADLEGLSRELERLEATAARLPQDLKEQKATAAALEARLWTTRGAWVVESTPEAQAAAAREFVQFCILPRVLNSPADALYCARFLRKAHVLGPPGFRLLAVMDRIFKDLGYLVRCCTSREATNLGIFFAELMALVTRWRGAKSYDRECANSEAFRSYKAGALQAVSHSEFVKLSANWHRKLTLDVFKTCLASADYMQMKNALLVLNRTVRMYPATREDTAELLRTLNPIRNDDPREDLKILARMYCTALEMAMRDKNRPVVDTRQEYAGLPPPPRKKHKPKTEASPAAPAVDDKEAKPAEDERRSRKGREDRRGSEIPRAAEIGVREDACRGGSARDEQPCQRDDQGDQRARRDERNGNGKDRREREREPRARARGDARGDNRNDRGRGGPEQAPLIAAEGSRRASGDRFLQRSGRSDTPPERAGDRQRGVGGTRDNTQRGSLRPDAQEFVPSGGKESRRGRSAEEPAERDRDAKRQKRGGRDDSALQSEQVSEDPRGRNGRGSREDLRDSLRRQRGVDGSGQERGGSGYASGRTGAPEQDVETARAAAQAAQEERSRQQQRGRDEGRRTESDVAENGGRRRIADAEGHGQPVDRQRNQRRSPPPPPEAPVPAPAAAREEPPMPESGGRKHSRDEDDEGDRGGRHKRQKNEGRKTRKDKKRRDKKEHGRDKELGEDRQQQDNRSRDQPPAGGKGRGDIEAPPRLQGRLGSGAEGGLRASSSQRDTGGRADGGRRDNNNRRGRNNR